MRIMLSVDFGYYQGKVTDELTVSTRTVTFLSDFSFIFLRKKIIEFFCRCCYTVVINNSAQKD